MNRIDRLSAILVLLQTKKIITALEIADRFGISLRTVYRDMKALNETGVPIGAESGVGYYIVDGYHLPPVMFTLDEAGSLLIGEKLINNFSDDSIKQHYKFALDKIRAVFPESHKEYFNQLESKVHVLHNQYPQNEEFDKHYISRIQHALTNKKCLQINYWAAYNNKESERIVEPAHLCFYSFQWHLIAYCRLRDEYRDFRVDRIKDLKILNDQIIDREPVLINDYFKELWEAEKLYTVDVKFKESEVLEVLNSRYFFGYYKQKVCKGFVIMSFAVNDFRYIANWIISLGNIVEEVISTELNFEIKRIISLLSEKYK